MFFFGTKDIKHYVKNWISDRREYFQGKTVVDVPAGNGVSSAQLHELGAKVLPMDLFPDFFRVADLTCQFADLETELPLQGKSVDFILCQEGVEHVSDQYKIFREFARVLKDQGGLLVTTPNYSSLRSRVSYLFNESELMGKIMPPNEVDSIWYAPGNKDKIYFGHVNLIGIQRLRLFAVLAGFKLKAVHANRVNYTALMMFPLLYPFILYFSWASYRRMKRKKGPEAAIKVRESFLLSISPRVLLQGHLIVEFEKVGLESQIKGETSAGARDFVT